MDSVPYRDVSYRSHKEKDMAWASVEPPQLKKILHFNDFFEKFDPLNDLLGLEYSILRDTGKVKKNSEKISLSIQEHYRIDSEIREQAKQRMIEFSREGKAEQSDIIEFRHFSPEVVDAVQRYIPEINYNAKMAMRGSDFNHLMNRHHPDEAALKNLVELLDHPAFSGSSIQ